MIFLQDYWSVSPTSVEPLMELAEWRAYECVLPIKSDCPSVHLVGFNTGLQEGRVSSAVTAYDAEQRVAMTESGRMYRLIGSPGYCPDGLHTFGRWVDRNNATLIRDVTDELISPSHRWCVAVVTGGLSEASPN